MINQLLVLTRPLFVLDYETTGVDPARDRIVEIGFQQWSAEGMVKEWRSLVNPGVPIPAEASTVHGITDAMVQNCRECNLPEPMHNPPSITELEIENGPTLVVKTIAHEFKPWPSFKQLAPNVAAGFRNCDFAGKNIRFDLRFTAAEMARAGVEWSYKDARIIDAERLEQLAVPRTLSHLHEKYVGAPHDGAHGALSDVRASATVIVHQLQQHASLPRDMDALHALQWPGWIDGDGKFRFVNGVPCVGQWGKWAGRPMRDVERGYWDWILNNDFSSDVRALARDAKLGKFPEAK